MKGLLERIARGETLVFDGAMGTLLQERGLQPGECPELWNVSHPDVIRGIAAAYFAAGSDMVETNTFGGTRCKLERFGLADRLVELNRAGVILAREAAGDRGRVAGSIGPTGQIAADEGGDASEAELYEAFAEQVRALLAGGPHALCVESMSSTVEAGAAVRASKAEADLPVICSFTFESGARGPRTMMGADPARAAGAALAAGADIIGANCGNGISYVVEVARQLRAAAPTTPIIVYPNAGAPVLQGGKTVFPAMPADMAALARELVAAGVNIIGGCCGAGPAHIAAIAGAVRQA